MSVIISLFRFRPPEARRPVPQRAPLCLPPPPVAIFALIVTAKCLTKFTQGAKLEYASAVALGLAECRKRPSVRHAQARPCSTGELTGVDDGELPATRRDY